MAHAATIPARFAASTARPHPRPVRTDEALDDLRSRKRGRLFLNETALIHGAYRAIGLAEADLLPFNA